MLLSLFAVNGPYSYGRHLAVVARARFAARVDPSDGGGEEEFLEFFAPRAQSEAVPYLGVEAGRAAALKVEFAAVFFGNVFDIDELGQGWEDLGMGEDEDFGGRDRVEPFLDPAPDRGKEGRSAEDLGKRCQIDCGS